jgi:GTP pyrophosphokinase
MPKTNGYEALHVTVMGPDGIWVEVQIRSERMDEIAEKGFAAHWKYKKASISQNEDEFDRWLKKIRDALNSPNEDAVEFLDNFKLSLYTSEITVFTPKGEARKLPVGTTALDFAYDIHSKIGNKAIGAKINHKIESITTPINNGDQIEIITADTAKPKPEWLNVVSTTKAKQAITSFLKREQQNNVERGIGIFEQRLTKFNIKQSGRVLRKVITAYECKTKDEFYSKVGAGIINLNDLEKVLKSSSSSKILKFWTLYIDDENNKNGGGKQEIFARAECCDPIPGDKIIGFRNPDTDEIIIHKATCPDIDRLASQYGKHIIKSEIKWSQHKSMSYLTSVEIRGIDRMGMLLDLSKVITDDFSINMRSVSISSHDGVFEGNLSLYVQDIDGLNALLDRIRKIKGIETVKRLSN